MQIEIYPNKMMKEFLKMGMVRADDTTALYIFCSSYQNRLDELKSFFMCNRNCMFLYFLQTEDRNNPNCFTEEMSKKIATYIQSRRKNSKKYPNGKIEECLQTIYVCCDDGQTRSAAIAASIYHYLGIVEEWEWFWNSPYLEPNTLVYQKLCHALGVEILDDELEQLKNMSQKSLQNAINEGTKITRNLFRYGINSKVTLEKRFEYFTLLKHLDNDCTENLVFSSSSSILQENYAYHLVMEVVSNSLEFIWMYVNRIIL